MTMKYFKEVTFYGMQAGSGYWCRKWNQRTKFKILVTFHCYTNTLGKRMNLPLLLAGGATNLREGEF